MVIKKMHNILYKLNCIVHGVIQIRNLDFELYSKHCKNAKKNMAASSGLVSYDSSSEEEQEIKQPELPPEVSATIGTFKSLVPLSRELKVNAAPTVAIKESIYNVVPITDKTKEVLYNPKYEHLYAPVIGPSNPFKSGNQNAAKNMLTGYVEPAHVNAFHFEAQRRTFQSYGYALDPSQEGSSGQILSSTELKPKAAVSTEEEAVTVFEKQALRAGDKRKRVKNDNPADIEGYKGPWAEYEDLVKVAKPSEEEQVELEEYLSKMQGRGKKQTDDKPMDERSTMHIKDPYDYQGRSFLHAPRDGVNLRSEEPPAKCFIPKKLIHTWSGHTKGVSTIRWFPKTAHLLLSCSMDCKIKLWEVYNERRLVQTYYGHRQAVRDINFNNDGTRFLSAGYDRYIKLWDTETGEVIGRFTNRKVAYCVKFNPEEDKQHLFVAGTQDKKIVCWDTRSNEIIQEYDRHLGAVNTITFVDDNRRFVSTSDDKSLRIWEWDIPVDVKYIAEPSMHSLPTVTMSPNQKWLACQSMDNKILVFSTFNRFKLHRKKTFTGHMVAGYACSIDFSPDMSYLISGDADGYLYIWDWKTSKLFNKFKAHDNVCIGALWHPHETSKVATAGWDNVIKFWD